MKKFILGTIVMAAIAACNSSGAKQADASQPLTDSIKKEAMVDSSNFTTVEWVDSIYHDLGKVKKGQTVEVPFTVKNTGDKPLIISAVEPGCGCTVADKPEKPIMPGEQEKIIGKFNSTGQSNGSHSKYITVRANTKPTTQHTLTFKVDVTD